MSDAALSQICLVLRCCHLLQYRLHFGYMACRCICFAIIVFYRSEIYCPICTLCSTMPSVLHILRWSIIGSVRNSSGASLRVRVQTETLPNWRSRWLINPNCPLVYGSMVNSQHVWIGRVVSGSPSKSIYRFILGSCICTVLIVSYQNRVFSNQ